MHYNFSSMRVLALESSCDESAAAVLDARAGLLAHELFSQVQLHRAYGGVVPELASRDHVRRLLPLVRGALEPAGTRPAPARRAPAAASAGRGRAIGRAQVLTPVTVKNRMPAFSCQKK